MQVVEPKQIEVNVLKEFFHQPRKAKKMEMSSTAGPIHGNIQTLTSNDFRANNLGQNIFSPFNSDSQAVPTNSVGFAAGKSSFGLNYHNQSKLVKFCLKRVYK